MRRWFNDLIRIDTSPASEESPEPWLRRGFEQPSSFRLENQKLRSRKSLAVFSTFSRIAGDGSIRAISTAPTIVE